MKRGYTSVDLQRKANPILEFTSKIIIQLNDALVQINHNFAADLIREYSIENIELKDYLVEKCLSSAKNGDWNTANFVLPYLENHHNAEHMASLSASFKTHLLAAVFEENFNYEHFLRLLALGKISRSINLQYMFDFLVNECAHHVDDISRIENILKIAVEHQISLLPKTFKRIGLQFALVSSYHLLCMLDEMTLFHDTNIPSEWHEYLNTKIRNININHLHRIILNSKISGVRLLALHALLLANACHYEDHKAIWEKLDHNHWSRPCSWPLLNLALEASVCKDYVSGIKMVIEFSKSKKYSLENSLPYCVELAIHQGCIRALRYLLQTVKPRTMKNNQVWRRAIPKAVHSESNECLRTILSYARVRKL